jgi:hypothetical protein
MPEQDLHATQAHLPAKVLDALFPPDYQSANMVQPSIEPFHSPRPSVATQGTTVLRGGATLSAMRCDHLDAIAFGQISIQAVIVIGFAGDQSRREVIEEAVSEDAFDEFAFVTGFRVYSCDRKLSEPPQR